VSAVADEARKQADPDAPPPPGLGSWRGLYVFLVVELLVTVALLQALTWWAS
jgi:hypothetical protein